MTNTESSNYPENNSTIDEINYVKILNRLKRGKKIIISFFIVFSSFGVFYSLYKKPVWQGSFQILADDKKSKNELAFSLGKILRPDRMLSSNKKTKEGILKSPLILLPVYEFVKKESIEKKIPISNDFQKWFSKKMTVKFIKGTDIVNITYKSTDKDLILSTLNLISLKYQEYSKRDREKRLTNEIDYLSDQAEIFKKRSEISLKKFNKFSIDNGLGDIDGFVALDNSNDGFAAFDNSNSKFINKNYDLKLDLSGQGLNQRINRGAGQRYSKQFNLLEKYETEYAKLSAQLKPNSSVLKNLTTNIENLRESLKRPNEILLEFINLRRISRRDESFLDNIENQLSLAKLEKVRRQEPWELISNPTIAPNRVEPARKQIVIFSSLFGLLFGSILAFIKDKSTGLLYEIEDFDDFIDLKLIDTLEKQNYEINDLILRFNLEKSANPDNYFVTLNDDFKTSKNLLNDIFTNTNRLNLIKINEINQIKKDANFYILAEYGKTSKSKLNDIKKYLKINASKFNGWFHIS